MQRRKAMSVRERKTLGERVTFELGLEELIKVWGGFREKGPSWQCQLNVFRIQDLFKEGKV